MNSSPIVSNRKLSSRNSRSSRSRPSTSQVTARSLNLYSSSPNANNVDEDLTDSEGNSGSQRGGSGKKDEERGLSTFRDNRSPTKQHYPSLEKTWQNTYDMMRSRTRSNTINKLDSNDSNETSIQTSTSIDSLDSYKSYNSHSTHASNKSNGSKASSKASNMTNGNDWGFANAGRRPKTSSSSASAKAHGRKRIVLVKAPYRQEDHSKMKINSAHREHFVIPTFNPVHEIRKQRAHHVNTEGKTIETLSRFDKQVCYR